jgi:hypothetical protein
LSAHPGGGRAHSRASARGPSGSFANGRFLTNREPGVREPGVREPGVSPSSRILPTQHDLSVQMSVPRSHNDELSRRTRRHALQNSDCFVLGTQDEGLRIRYSAQGSGRQPIVARRTMDCSSRLVARFSRCGIVAAWRFAWSVTPAIAANRSRLLSGSASAGSRHSRSLVCANAAAVQGRRRRREHVHPATRRGERGLGDCSL